VGINPQSVVGGIAMSKSLLGVQDSKETKTIGLCETFLHYEQLDGETILVKSVKKELLDSPLSQTDWILCTEIERE
jgi:hypothetical protein